MDVDIRKASTTKEIRAAVHGILMRFEHMLPVSRNARILLKPNLNANMNALTGNTTDLRLIAAVVSFLKSAGYRNITIGEGTNSGYYRNSISVISRLGVDRLARYFGVNVLDLNQDQPKWVHFENAVQAGVASTCYQTDFFINLPKIKTHFEVGMSVCLKNLMGCLVGQDNKKKTHQNLAANIVNLNQQLKPNLHIVDGLIAMEGLGPTRGVPLKMGMILAGTDPYLLDLVCAKIAGFDYQDILTLKVAETKGLIGESHLQYLKTLELKGIGRPFMKPEVHFPAAFIHNPKRQKYFLAIRNTRFFSWMASTSLFGYLLYRSGLRQDNFIQKELKINRLKFNADQCQVGCTKCTDYCPLCLFVPDVLDSLNHKCIDCLYCFMVCPKHAIEFEGKPGFLTDQLKQYDDIVRKIS